MTIVLGGFESVAGALIAGVILGPHGLGRFAESHPWIGYITFDDQHRGEPSERNDQHRPADRAEGRPSHCAVTCRPRLAGGPAAGPKPSRELWIPGSIVPSSGATAEFARNRG